MNQFKIPCVFLILLAVTPFLPISAGGQDTSSCPTPNEADLMAALNEERYDNGLPPFPLPADARLMIAAQRHTDDMVANDFFSHIGSDGSLYFERQLDAGYSGPIGEAIIGGPSYLTPASAVQAWMGHPTYRDFILSPDCEHLGVGYAYSESATYTHYYTVEFGNASYRVEPVCGCCSERVGDANGLGGDEPTIGDVSVMIDAKFITGNCDGILDCITEADINQSGGVDAGCDDITIGDISTLIDYLFITGPSLGLPECL